MAPWCPVFTLSVRSLLTSMSLLICLYSLQHYGGYSSYGFRWHSDNKPYRTGQWQVSIWLVRVPSKPISHKNRCHKHFLAQNTLIFKFHKKEKLIWKIANPRWVWYAVISNYTLPTESVFDVRMLHMLINSALAATGDQIEGTTFVRVKYSIIMICCLFHYQFTGINTKIWYNCETLRIHS